MKNPFFLCAGLVSAALLLPASAIVSINYVSIGNPGNQADPTTGYGAVNHAFQISKNETTIADYVQFLNAVAASDPYGLWNPNMTILSTGTIARYGSAGSYTYMPIQDSPNRPINYVSWFDAARFCNWLHHGQPTGALGAGLIEDGAYTLLGAVSGIVPRNANAKVWIPSENEWYKAAYYDPTPGAGGGDNYWLYATQSNFLNGNTIGVANSAAYFDTDFVRTQNGLQTAFPQVGAYGPNSDSFYTTNDQTGGMREWTDGSVGADRVTRGGSYNSQDDAVRSTSRVNTAPTDEASTRGFRLASIPEPGTTVVAMLFSAMMLIRRRK